jgi:type II secretory pathway pseudopilin PulG
MIAVLILGLLCAIAIPSFALARRNVQNTRFISDLRVAAHAFEQCIMDTGKYPPDCLPRVIPAGTADYLAGVDWTKSTPIGGFWAWDYKATGYKAGISVYFGATPDVDARLLEIDRKMDDGSLFTGLFRKRTGGCVYIIDF